MPLDPRLPARVVVAGGGIVALSAALAFRRTLPGTAILLVETPVDPAALTECATRLWPVADAFNDRIGIGAAMLLRGAGASVHAADRFERWGDSAPWLLPTDGDALDSQVFQHWLRDRDEPLSALVPNAALAERDLVAAATPPHLRIDPDAYRALLSHGVDAAAIDRRTLTDFAVEPDEHGNVAALVGDGERIAADWFVDATGPAATIARAVGAAREDWSHRLPCDLVAIGGDEPPRWSPLDRYIATAAGWIARVPGTRVSRTMMGFASAVTDRERAARAFRTETGQPLSQLVAIAPGRRDGWTGNVLAIGDAAIQLDPIAGLGLALAHSTLLRVSALLPGRACTAVETAEFNRRTRAEHAAAADFAALHYRTTRTGAFWDHARSLAPSDGLARLLPHFTARGRIPHRDDDPVPQGSWRALLVGLGLGPSDADAVTRSFDPRASKQLIAAARADVDAAARTAIPYRAWHDAALRRPA